MLTELRVKPLSSLSLAFLFAVFFACTAQAQDPDSLVLNVTVTNEKSVLTRGLTIDSFSVIADKQAQRILSLSDREVPASIGILIDNSGSQSIGKSETAVKIHQQFREGFQRFFQLSHPANEYFVVTFNSKVQLVRDWTSEVNAVVETLNSLTFQKETSMYDAIRLGLEKVKTGRNSKQVLILISDGQDTASKVSFKKARDLLKASDVLLYCVGISNVIVEGTNPYVDGIKILEEFSSNTGGRGLFMTNASGPQAFKEVFELIALELRAQYQLVIVPVPSGSKAKWQKLKINAKRVDATGRSEQLVARTRRWYYK